MSDRIRNTFYKIVVPTNKFPMCKLKQKKANKVKN